MNQTHGNTAGTKLISAPHSRSFSGPFGRMFRILPAWEPKGSSEAQKLQAIAAIAVEMAVAGGGDNTDIPSGYTYFGQFVDHDLTFDPRSSLQKQNDPESLEDFRSPAFDLDCLYGRGPEDQPYMYGQAGDGNGIEPGMLRLDPENVFGEEDLLRVGPKIEPPLPRDPLAVIGLPDDVTNKVRSHRAVIGDKRNDENTFVSQLQLVFVRFHNEVFKNKTSGDDVAARFKEAQRIVRWHYQWVVVHDWLRRLCGQQFYDEEIVNRMLKGGDCPGKAKLCYYDYHDYPFMPVEFSVAAYRFGHSMVREKYKINRFVPVLDTFTAGATHLLGDFRGFRPLPPNWTIDWSFFFELKGQLPQLNKKPAVVKDAPLPSLTIDRFLAKGLTAMPDAIADPKEVPADPMPPMPVPGDSIARSLAYRNLLRGWRLGLPSGEAVARLMGLGEADIGMSLDGDTPLWRFILDEAAAAPRNGANLGPVGATIVAETFIGLLAADPSSYFRIDPGWQPDLVAPIGERFELRDIIKFAGARIGSHDDP